MTKGSKTPEEREREFQEFYDWLNAQSLREQTAFIRMLCEKDPAFGGLLNELRLDQQAETRAVEYVKKIRAQAIDPTATRAQRADADWWLREHGYDDDSLLQEDEDIAGKFPVEG